MLCIWHVACGMWRVACGVWHVACGVWHVACGVWRVRELLTTCYLLQVHELLVQSQQLDHAIEELLEEDIDMTRMYLSKLHTHHAQPLTSMGGGGVNGLGPSPSPSPSPLRRSASAHTPPEVEVEAHEEAPRASCTSCILCLS